LLAIKYRVCTGVSSVHTDKNVCATFAVSLEEQNRVQSSSTVIGLPYHDLVSPGHNVSYRPTPEVAQMTAFSRFPVFALALVAGCASSHHVSGTERVDDARVVIAGQSPDHQGDAEKRISELKEQLATARRTIDEQKQLLRGQASGKTKRGLDETLALFPVKYPEGDWSPSETVFEDCWFESIDGLRLHGWSLKHDKPTAAIVFCHGNAGNVTHRGYIAALLHKRLGASVLVFDYRGYGRSEGVPTVDGLIRDARAARAWLAEHEGIAESDVVLMGESLGGGVAVQVAAADGARGLVVQNTFSSLRDAADAHYPKLLVNIVVKDRLNSAEAIANYKGPLLQTHGDSDSVVPFASGKRLFDAANEPKTFVEVPGGDHNDLPAKTFLFELDQFIGGLPPVKPLKKPGREEKPPRPVFSSPSPRS
jgi:uncharacterized protein